MRFLGLTIADYVPDSKGWNFIKRPGRKPAQLCQKDLDARLTKKNNETHYGYKNHA